MIQGSDIKSKLSSTSAIAALVGSRVYPDYRRAADVTYPYIIYKRENTATLNTYGGANGFGTCDLLLAAIGKTQQQAEAVASAIVTALDGDTSTWGSTYVQGCFLADDGVADDVETEPETEAVIAYIKEIRLNLAYGS